LLAVANSQRAVLVPDNSDVGLSLQFLLKRRTAADDLHRVGHAVGGPLR